ncbi:MAG: hypothetical protein EOO97_00275 [Pedobacter sp.]|nr:MAG: hypothetical protein EOO97_00275 [Pedobacter sp.]
MNLIERWFRSAKQIMSEYVADKTWTDAELKISQREVGGVVELIDGEGNLSQAPDGEYTMEDGFQFTVKDGQIEAIAGEDKPAEEAPADEVKAEDVPTEDAPAEDVAADPNKEVEDLKAQVADLEAKLTALIGEVEAIKASTEVAATKEDVAEYSKAVTELNSTIQKLAKVPVQFAKTNQTNEVKDQQEQRKSDLAVILGKAIGK